MGWEYHAEKVSYQAANRWANLLNLRLQCYFALSAMYYRLMAT